MRRPTRTRRLARPPKAGLFALLALAVLLTGCTEELLEKEVLGAYDESVFLGSETDALTALNAAYAPSNFTVRNDNRRWVLGDVASDDVVTGGDGTQADILAVDQFTINPENTNLLRQWRIGYEAIANANLVLERVPDIDMDEGLRERILAEAAFLRGYHYFELAIVFGGVPLITSVLSPEALNVPRASLEETYEQVERDLEYAAERLPEQYDAGEVGRATRGAALGVLAKAHLYQEDWAAALDHVDAVKAIGRYRLLDDFAELFRESGDNNAESIWELQHAANLQPSQGNYLNVWLAPRLDNGGFGFGLPTQDLLDAFDDDDPRLDVTLGYVGGTWFDGRPYIGDQLYSATDISQKKLIQGGVLGQPRAQSGLNVTYLRYADLLLMEAEAAAETGDLQRAIARVNDVRARANNVSPGALELYELDGRSGGEVLELVYAERRLELAVEMHRFFDIRRWGLAEQLLAAQGIDFDPARDNLFPIPQRELDVNDALRQNPGY